MLIPGGRRVRRFLFERLCLANTILFRWIHGLPIETLDGRSRHLRLCRTLLMALRRGGRTLRPLHRSDTGTRSPKRDPLGTKFFQPFPSQIIWDLQGVARVGNSNGSEVVMPEESPPTRRPAGTTDCGSDKPGERCLSVLASSHRRVQQGASGFGVDSDARASPCSLRRSHRVERRRRCGSQPTHWRPRFTRGHIAPCHDWRPGHSVLPWLI